MYCTNHTNEFYLTFSCACCYNPFLYLIFRSYTECRERNDKYNKLPLLGKYISTEDYYRRGSRMELTCILIITGTVLMEGPLQQPKQHSNIDQKDPTSSRILINGTNDSHQGTAAAVAAAPTGSASFIVSTSIDPLMIPVVCSLDNALEYDQV